MVHARLHSRSKRDFEESKRYMCYTLDACLRTCDPQLNPTGKMISIMDLKGLSGSSRSRIDSCHPCRLLRQRSCAGIGMDVIDQKVLQTVFDLLSNHYPERHAWPACSAPAVQALVAML